jgi:hypothetical protein
MDCEYAMKLRIIGYISICFLSLNVWAYPNLITYGYHSCSSCHYNPMGNGPLTDYGRAFGASELADRQFVSDALSKDDEKLAELSGFFFGKPPVSWLRPSASYRGLYYQVNPGQKGEKAQWINMDASLALVAKFFKDDKLTFVVQGGYAPKPMQARNSGKEISEFRSREHYIGYRFTKTFGVYVGLMDKAFGIRVPDHIAFSRSVTRLNQNDQTHGVLFHLLTKNWEWAVQPFVGNMVQDEELRQKGATTQLSYKVGDVSRVGISFAKSNSEYFATTMYSTDFRTGFGESSSLMLEVGQVENTPKGLEKTTNRYIFMQNHWKLHRGLYSLLTVEMLQPDISTNGEIYRFGPGVQYFPTNRLEVRADIYDMRQRSSAAYTDDMWAVTGQVHLWF